MAAPTARPAASIGIVAPPAIGSTSGSVRASQRDSMISCAAMVSRSGAGPAATRAPRRCRAPPPMSMPTTVRRASGVPARRTTNTTSGESASTSDATPRDANASTIAFLTTPRSWSGDASKSDDGPTSTERRRCVPSREPVVRRERGQQVGEERLEAHRSARAEIPGDSRRRAVMARRHPCDARVEGIEQRRFPLALRFLEAHVERRAHHEPLELRLHDAVRAAGTGQAQLVATLRAHASLSCFISSTATPEEIAAAIRLLAPLAASFGTVLRGRSKGERTCYRRLRTFLVPVVVVGPHAAPGALRARPSSLASRAFAVRLEGVPDLAAAGRARPRILARRAPLARRAADAGEILVDVVFENARNEPVLAADEPDDERKRSERKREKVN